MECLEIARNHMQAGVTMQAPFLGRGPSACVSQLRLIVEDLHRLSLALNLITLAPEISHRFALPPYLLP